MAVAIGYSIAIAIVLWADSGRSSLLHRGDFPAFYAAAELVLTGRGKHLYDTALQQAVENRFWPELGSSYYYFAYPPYFAALLSPLALVSPESAGCLFTFLLAAALLGALAMARRFTPLFRTELWRAFFFSLCFAPLAGGLLGKQNVTLGMLCYAAALNSLSRGGRRGELLAGVWLGCWLFKPHYSLIALVFFVLAGRWRVLGGALLPAAVYCVAALMVSGVDWPWLWWTAAMDFASRDFAANGHQMVSLVAVARAVTRVTDSAALIDHGILFIGWSTTLLVAIAMAWRFFRLRGSGEDRDLCAAGLLIGPTVLLISPHAMYYDLGFLLISVCPFIDPKRKVWSVGLPILLGLVFVVSIFKGSLSVSPLVLLPTAALLLAWRDRATRDSEARTRFDL